MTAYNKNFDGSTEKTSTSLFWLLLSVVALFGGLAVLAACLYITTQPGLMQLLGTM